MNLKLKIKPGTVVKIQTLRSLVKKGESEILEFKETTGQLSEAMKTVCAFLNSKIGGTVLIGIKDNGEIIGQMVSDKTRQEIAKERSKIEPHADFDIDFVSISAKKEVIVFSVNTGEKIPYVYDARPYMRSQSTTKRMPMQEFEYLLQNRRPSTITWEGLTTNKCTLADLDDNRIRQVVRIGVSEGRLIEASMSASISEILTKFELMVDDKLTNAAVILFCKNIRKQFIQAELRLARFMGTDKSEFIDEKAVQGNAFDLYEEAMKFLTTYLPVAGRIEEGNPFRVTTPAIPYKVLREGLVNALCHHDWSIPGGSIAIAFYDDRVNITSTGVLPYGIKLNQLDKEHSSVQRNPLIAKVFYTCHMIERWGRGTFDMVEICKKSGNPVPIFDEITNSFSVTLTLKEPIQRVGISSKTLKIEDLTIRQEDILAILKQGPQTREQIMNTMNNSLSERTLQRELVKLKSFALIDSKGKTKTMIWFLLRK